MSHLRLLTLAMTFAAGEALAQEGAVPSAPTPPVTPEPPKLALGGYVELLYGNNFNHPSNDVERPTQ
jgi:hypothetical protein